MHTKRLTITYVALAAALLGLFALNLFWGSVAISPRGVVQALLGRGQDELAANILLQLRLPRAVMVVLLGAALSVAGYLLQTFFANPIAGPFVMGISSGAKLVVALTMVVFLNHGLLTNSLTLILAAFAGSMAAMAFVLSVARRVHRMSILVICGVMIGYICSAVTDIVVAFAQDSNIVNLHNWSMGSSAWRWCCFPVCWPPASRRLRGPFPLWVLRCRTWSSRRWEAPSRCMCCRAVRWVGRRSACCVI